MAIKAVWFLSAFCLCYTSTNTHIHTGNCTRCTHKPHELYSNTFGKNTFCLHWLGQLLAWTHLSRGWGGDGGGPCLNLHASLHHVQRLHDAHFQETGRTTWQHLEDGFATRRYGGYMIILAAHLVAFFLLCSSCSLVFGMRIETRGLLVSYPYVH